MVLSSGSPIIAAASTEPVRKKISVSIEKATDDAYIDALVRLKDEIDAPQIKRKVALSSVAQSKEKREQAVRKEIVEASAALAETSQKDILDRLHTQKQQGLVQSFKSFYIVNCIHVVAKKSVLVDLAARDDVAEVVENQTIHLDPPVANEPEKGRMRRSAASQEDKPHVPWNLKAIGADRAQKAVKDSDQVVTVAIIDSGVDGTHPAIAKNYRGQNADLAPYSWYNAVSNKTGADESPFDDRGHGTHVCGTILGTRDDGALLGIAPKTKWIAVKVFDANGETDNAKLLAAGEWILAPRDKNGNKRPDLAPNVVNNSWGGNSSDGFYRDIVKKWRDAGIFPVFSAGNVSEFNNGGDHSIGTPAAYPEAYAVGAIRKDEKVAKFSLRGKSDYTNKWKPDLVAPGVNILSTLPNNRYAIETGTSMASPHVSGVVALMLQANRDLSVDQIEKILNETATPLKDDFYTKTPNHGYGYGKVNAYNAVELAKSQKKGADIDTHTMGQFTGRLLARGEDGEKPVVEHHPMNTIFTTYQTTFDANARDNAGIESVKLHLDVGEGFKPYPLELKKGNRIDGYYSLHLSPSLFKGSGGTYFIEATDVNGQKTKTEAVTFSIKSGVSIGYVQDFEKDCSGFEFGGESNLWKWGALDPAQPNHKMIGTGSYHHNLKGDTIAVMPPIDLTQEKENAILRFRHRYDLGNSEHAWFDQAEVWIAEVDETSDVDHLNWQRKRTFQNHSQGWVDESIDLSAYKGKKICVMLGLRGNGEYKTEGGGWLIDDISIEKSPEKTPQTPSESISLLNKRDGKISYTFSPVKDEDITAYTLYRSNAPDGPFTAILTVNKGDTKNGFGKYGITLTDTPLPQKGTYYYYAVSKIGNIESAPSKILSHTFTKGRVVKHFDFEEGQEGFTTGKNGTEAWDYGILTYGDPFSTNYKKPISKQSLGKNPGPGMWATGMDDYRKSNQRYELLSPAMDLSSLNDATLYYQNWFGSSGKRGTDEYDTYDNDVGEIYVSQDGGKQWTKIFTLDANALEAHGRKHCWFTQGVSIPSDYLTSQFRMKFVLNSGSDTPTLSSEQCGGWYIDDVSIHSSDRVSATQTQTALPFRLQQMHPATLLNEQKNTDIIPLVGTLSIEETGVQVTSEMGSGHFTLNHPAGKYTAVAYAEGYAPKRVPVTIENGKVLTQDIYLDKASPLSLQVQAINEKQESVSIRAGIYKDGQSEVLAEKEGKNLRFDALLPGDYELIVNAQGYYTYRKKLHLQKDETLSLSLKPAENTSELVVGYDREVALELAGQGLKDRAFANRIDNNRPLQVKSVHYYLTKLKNADLSNSRYRISIYDKNDRDGLPGPILFTKELTFEKEGWNTLGLDHVYVDGPFYIAFTKLTGDVALGIDNKTAGSTSVQMFNHAWNEPETAGMYMLKATVSDLRDKMPEKCSVSFDANGGKGSMDAISIEKGKSYTLPSCRFTPPNGKVFDAWRIIDATMKPGSPVVVSKDMRIKALWKDQTPVPSPIPTPSPTPTPTPNPMPNPSPFYQGQILLPALTDEENGKDYANHWAKTAIDYCLTKAYFKNIALEKTFDPEKPITRAEFVTVLARYANIPEGPARSGFNDVDDDQYYACFISWARQNQIIYGRGNNMFAPNANITRAEMATIIHRMSVVLNLKYDTDKLIVPYHDQSSIPDWAQDSVRAMTQLGIVQGDDLHRFNPKGSFKRCELAQIIYNFSHTQKP